MDFNNYANEDSEGSEEHDREKLCHLREYIKIVMNGLSVKV